MTQRGRIIKRDNIEITGSILLEMDATALPEPHDHADHPARVRVAEQHADRAILEVTCGCGRVIQIQCDYANSTVMSQH